MTRQPPLLLIVAIFTIAFLVPAWPWLSGAVTIPYDAKSTFLPPVEFMARAFAAGQSPFWTPNIYAGWPMVADPQSMLLSPLHVLLARALDRSSTRYGVLAGIAGAMIVLGRDQVALLEVYVLAGFVVAHWCGAGFAARMRASLKPLIAGGIVGFIIIALPILLTE